MKLEAFNKLNREDARMELFRCCGSTAWANKVIEQFPFGAVQDLKLISDKAWFSCMKADWLEAFSHHPKIGERKLGMKFSETAAWANQEQAAVKSAAEDVLNELVSANERYEKKFGFIFIVCATGKSADEMLSLLNERINNEPEKELHIAINEQNKITHLRIDKLFS